MSIVQARVPVVWRPQPRQAENVEFRWNSVVSALLSGDRLTGVRLRDTVTGEESSAETTLFQRNSTFSACASGS